MVTIATVRYERIGQAFRAVRLHKHWRQADVAARAGVSRWIVGQVERGRIGSMPLDTMLKVARALDMRIDVLARWHGGDLDRMLSARHAALGELLVRFLTSLPGWVVLPEVSFSVGAERGVIDILAWHAETRSLLVIELKTEIVDIQESLGTLDRKRRLADRIAGQRGWHPATVSVWLVVADGTTTRRRVAAHRAILRAALPDDGWRVRRWLISPSGKVAGLSLWSSAGGTDPRRSLTSRKRVRCRSTRLPTREPTGPPEGARATDLATGI